MPECGSQCILCDLPIRYDPYRGCTHNCNYCFVKRKSGLDIKDGESIASLEKFIKGERTGETKWCDWDIPIHIGGMTDPFQPYEKKAKKMLRALEIFADTGYPVVISTKGILCCEEPYFSILKECNVVMQISMLCEKYDSLEPGAPTFLERLKMAEKLAPAVKRVIIRAQPYVPDIKKDIEKNIPLFAEAGAYGIVFEGMKFVRKKKGLQRCGGDWVIPKDILRMHFEAFKKICHERGMKFYSGENRLRTMGDSMTCCGIDGLDGFVPNTYNACHIMNGDKVEPTESQKRKGTATPFQTVYQTAGYYQNIIKGNSFEGVTKWTIENKKKYMKDIFGL